MGEVLDQHLYVIKEWRNVKELLNCFHDLAWETHSSVQQSHI